MQTNAITVPPTQVIYSIIDDIDYRCQRLTRLLQGVRDAPNPVGKFFDNAIEGLSPGDYEAVWDLAGFILDNRDAILGAIGTKH
jgi:hypothetical protein